MKKKYDGIYIFLLVATILIFVTTYVNHLKSERDMLATELSTQIELANDYKTVSESFGELADIYPENRAMVLAIAMTESSCSYKVKHPDKQTVGIGGIKPSIWSTDNPTNSLMAIEEVVEKLQQMYPKDTPYNIIRRYKGGVTNLKSTQQCFDLYSRLCNLL